MSFFIKLFILIILCKVEYEYDKTIFIKQWLIFIKNIDLLFG